MYRGHTVGVVVPAYNEEGFVGDVIETMPDYVDRVYVIDDASTDGTWAEIQRYADTANEVARRTGTVHVDGDLEPIASIEGDHVAIETDGAGLVYDLRVVAIQHEQNRGVGGAIKTGYKHALEDEVDITAVMGGDGQMDPQYLPRLLDPIVEDVADYAKGNRLVYREYRNGMSKWRFIGNSILTFLTKIASGYWKTMDPQNGYTAVSSYGLENAGIGSMYEFYGYCNDLLVKLNAKGMRVADVAIPAEYGDETSHISYATYIPRVSGMLLKNFLWRLKVKYLVLDFHPLALFYYFGTVMAFAGVFSGLWTVNSFLTGVGDIFMRGSMSLLLFSIGSMFLMFAMLFDMQVNEDREVQYRD